MILLVDWRYEVFVLCLLGPIDKLNYAFEMV